jgi:hypothetical protein
VCERAGGAAAVCERGWVQAGAFAAAGDLRGAVERDVLGGRQHRTLGTGGERQHTEAGFQEEGRSQQAQAQSQEEGQGEAQGS